MTETRATPPTRPVFPPGRYGRRREPRRSARWFPVALAVLGAVVGLVIAFDLYRRYGNPPYRATVTGYQDVTDDGITVSFEVSKPAGEPALCRVRARARHGGEVGHAEVLVSEAATRVLLSHRVTTTERPFIGEVTRCRRAP